MSSLDERRNSFENKFAHDESLRFRITARRNKLLGLWASDRLGKSGEAAAAYASEVVAADIEAPGGAGFLRKVVADLGVTEDDVRAQMENLLKVAEDQITSE
jgi:hypothetical protein